MKKLLMLLLSLSLVLTACSTDEENKESSEETKTEQTNSEEVEAEPDADTVEETEEETEEERGKTTYGAEEEWVVDGLFKLTVHSAVTTDDRNEYSEEEPEQVVRITYSYENLGIEKDIQDLFITPSNLIDGEGEMAETYPVDAKAPQPTPIGAKMKDAQEAYGLNNKSNEVTVTFEVYDNDSNEHTAMFKIPVKSE